MEIPQNSTEPSKAKAKDGSRQLPKQQSLNQGHQTKAIISCGINVDVFSEFFLWDLLN